MSIVSIAGGCAKSSVSTANLVSTMLKVYLPICFIRRRVGNAEGGRPRADLELRCRCRSGLGYCKNAAKLPATSSSFSGFASGRMSSAALVVVRQVSASFAALHSVRCRPGILERGLQHRELTRAPAQREGFVDPFNVCVTQLEISGACIFSGMLRSGSFWNRKESWPAH